MHYFRAERQSTHTCSRTALPEGTNVAGLNVRALALLLASRE
jgi:hypothetical protein